MSRFLPHYVGGSLIDGIELPMDRRIVLNHGGPLGRARELAFKITGRSFSLLRQLRRIDPELIHAHFGPDGLRVLPTSHALQVPLVVTFHGFDATVSDLAGLRSFYGHRRYIRERKLLIEQGSLFVAVSKFIRKRLLEQGFPEDRVVVNYTGVDTEYFTPDDSIQRDNTVLFVGRLVEQKGAIYLIRAMELVQEEIPDARLVVIGDGPSRPELETEAAKRIRNFQFLGTKPVEDVRRWMNKAKVFSVPSVVVKSGAAEGFGMVFIEAQSMGVPVVTFRTGGISEAVKDGLTGFLCNERDWKSLAGHIKWLLQNEKIWEEISDNAQRFVRDTYSLSYWTKRLESLYVGLIGTLIDK